jgi:hypothetical protein
MRTRVPCLVAAAAALFLSSASAQAQDPPGTDTPPPPTPGSSPSPPASASPAPPAGTSPPPGYNVTTFGSGDTGPSSSGDTDPSSSDNTEPPAGEVGPPVLGEKPPPHLGGQRYIGIGAHIGVFRGFGASLRAGHPYVGVEAFGGWQPLIILLNTPGGTEALGHNSGQVGAHMYITFNPDSKIAVGLTGGYRYNSVLGHGIAGGLSIDVDVSRKLVFDLVVGPVVFPQGERGLRAEGQLPAGTEFGFPSPTVQLGLGLGLVVFP